MDVIKTFRNETFPRWEECANKRKPLFFSIATAFSPPSKSSLLSLSLLVREISWNKLKAGLLAAFAVIDVAGPSYLHEKVKYTAVEARWLL